MVISSQALFHFTKRVDDIFQVFERGFSARYCLEDFSGFFGEAGSSKWQWALAMVCFCDLPLSQLGEHVHFYGCYGIGMTKEWGIASGINPVLYLHPRSDLAAHILPKVKEGVGAGHPELHGDYLELLRYIKPYEGYVDIDGKVHHKRFYDEKEWRWVPQPAPHLLTREEYLNSKRNEAAHRKLAEIGRLFFKPEDVKYIIVAKEAEKLPVINRLEAIYTNAGTDTLKLLASKLISVEQIRSDF